MRDQAGHHQGGHAGGDEAGRPQKDAGAAPRPSPTQAYGDGRTGQFHGYTVRQENWNLGGRTFSLVWPADIDALLDSPETQRRFDRDEYMPYWAQPWPASVLLAEAVLNGEEGKGRPAVEIGCGVGLVSLAAAARGWSVVASDYDPDAIAFAELNARQNALELAGTQRIDYRGPLPEPRYHLVLGSDLLYETKKAEPVARWIASALPPGGYALLSDPNRTAAETFPACAAAAGLKAECKAIETMSPSGLLIRGRIWQVTRSTDA